MKRFILVLMALLASFGSVVMAQDVANLYMAGVSYNTGGTPAVAGSALYAHQINTSGTYAFSMFDALPTTYKPFVVTTNIGAGIAQRVATVAGVSIFMPTSAGISFSGTNTGWSWSTGVGAPFKLHANTDGSSWYVMPNVRVLKSSVAGGTGYQPIFGALIGWGK